MAMVEMELVEIQISESGGHQVVILQEKVGERSLPIFIGTYEAVVLGEAVKGNVPPRPLTHDLALNIVDGLGGRLTGIVVDNLEDNIFFGKLLVRMPHGGVEKIDTRPSDAIILAVKAKAPIYVEEEVLAAVVGDEDE